MDTSFDLFSGIDYPLLPAYSKPLQDELLSSWLARMSQDHGLQVYEFCKLCWPKLALFERDIDRNINDETINDIAARTNCSFEEVKSTSLRYFEHKLYNPLIKKQYSRTKWILPVGREAFKYKNKGLMFCPGCLSNDQKNPYYRKKWRLALSIVCPDCECYLYDCCPRCRSPICFFRNSIGLTNHAIFKHWGTCYNCKKDLRENEIKHAPADVVKLQKHLYEILETGFNSKVIYPILYFDVLHQVIKLLITPRAKLQPLRKDLFKQHEMPFFSIRSGKPIFELLEYEKRIHVIWIAYWLLEDWPTRFLFYCRKHKLRSTDVLMQFTNAPFWYESVILNEIYRPRNTQSEVPFGLYSIFGTGNKQSAYHRHRTRL